MNDQTGIHPGPHESWRELAEHSLTHDDLKTDTRDNNGGWIHVGNSSKVAIMTDGTVRVNDAIYEEG